MKNERSRVFVTNMNAKDIHIVAERIRMDREASREDEMAETRNQRHRLRELREKFDEKSLTKAEYDELYELENPVIPDDRRSRYD